MSELPKTPAELTARLVSNVVAPMILGEVHHLVVRTGKQVDPKDRAKLGLPEGGTTFVYEMGESNVVMDLSGNRAMISFMKGDVDTAIQTFDRELRMAMPGFKQREDVVHPRGGHKRLRVYDGQLGTNMLSTIEVDYPEGGAKGDDRKFVVRMSVYIRWTIVGDN